MLDANDNAPRFLTDSFREVYINETAKRGTTVVQVMARDDDIDNNGKVSWLGQGSISLLSSGV